MTQIDSICYYNDNILMQFNTIFHDSMNSIFQMKISDIFCINNPNKDCRCLLEPPQWGGSNKHPQSMFCVKKKKKKSENVHSYQPPLFPI